MSFPNIFFQTKKTPNTRAHKWEKKIFTLFKFFIKKFCGRTKKKKPEEYNWKYVTKANPI